MMKERNAETVSIPKPMTSQFLGMLSLVKFFYHGKKSAAIGSISDNIHVHVNSEMV